MDFCRNNFLLGTAHNGENCADYEYEGICSEGNGLSEKQRAELIQLLGEADGVKVSVRYR